MRLRIANWAQTRRHVVWDQDHQVSFYFNIDSLYLLYIYYRFHSMAKRLHATTGRVYDAMAAHYGGGNGIKDGGLVQIILLS